MRKIEKAKVFNLDGAIRAMRNPMNSWDRSDSQECIGEDGNICEYGPFYLGKNDLELMRKLYKAGPEHSKYLRQIFVCFDLSASSFVWAEMDTYKIGVTRNSCSFQHKGTNKHFELVDFDAQPIDEESKKVWEIVIAELNRLRSLYLATQDYEYFKAIRRLLPCGWIIKATLTMSYANVMNIINQREHHKLSEWHEICNALRQLPFVKDIRGEK